MAQHEVTLTHGIKGQKDAVLRESAADDLIQAGMESEKLVATPDGYQLVTSPTLMAAHCLCRQIVRIGDLQGPLTLKELGRLRPDDMNQLMAEAENLDQAALGVAQRGRDDGADGSAG